VRCLNASIERATLHPRQPLCTHVLSLTPATLAASSATGTSIPLGLGPRPVVHEPALLLGVAHRG
jgi:hypothetical protein